VLPSFSLRMKGEKSRTFSPKKLLQRLGPPSQEGFFLLTRPNLKAEEVPVMTFPSPFFGGGKALSPFRGPVKPTRGVYRSSPASPVASTSGCRGPSFELIVKDVPPQRI